MRNASASALWRIGRGLLVLALVAGWQSALLHPLKHVDETGQLVHAGGLGSPGEKQNKSDPSRQLCDALAALTSCASSAARAFGDPSSEYQRFLQAPGIDATSSAPPFLAQGPPLFS